MASRDELIDLVHAWQREYGMTPRSDSKLTRMFADGEVDMSADEVARELVAVDFVYRHTLYGDVIEDFMRLVAARLRERHRISWPATWNIVRFYAPIALKLMCVNAAGVRIPPNALLEA